MTKEYRLDQILQRLGYATEAQIQHALQKQRGLGGRLGTHLIYSGSVTEAQLAHALSLQFQVPAFDPAQHQVSAELLKRFPPGFVRQYQIMPVDYNPGNGVLKLVVVDPQNTRAVAAVTRSIRCSAVELLVTPEVTFDNLVEAHAPEAGLPFDQYRQISLPELFTQADPTDVLTEAVPAAGAPQPDEIPRVLLVSDEVFLANFLAPIFAREGLELVTVAEVADVRDHLEDGTWRQVLVSGGMVGRFRTWLRQRAIPQPGCEVAEFGTVSAALLENPVTYTRMFESLVGALRLVADSHGGHGAASPPYELLRREVRALGTDVELGRLAIDALELAVLLITPDCRASAGHPGDGVIMIGLPNIDWELSLSHAESLNFPWDVAGALRAFRELLSESVNLDEFNANEPEMALAAQVLALVWHHHEGIARRRGAAGDHLRIIRTELRRKSGRLARSEVIEAYLRLIERTAEDLHAPAFHQVFVVGDDSPVPRQLTTRLRHLGYQAMAIADVTEAETMCQRQAPTAIFIHDKSLPRTIADCRAAFCSQSRVFLYAVTAHSDPSQVLNLFDAGFDDVFSLPRDIDIVAARLRQAIKDVANSDPMAPAAPAAPGSFQATFGVLAFTDLMQALSQSRKSVRIRLARGNGEAAVVHLEQGRLVHAACDDLQGEEAVHRLVAWEDDGQYAVEPAADFPAANVSLPLDSVLMEGCRLLDESKVG